MKKVTLNVPKHIAIIMDGNGRWAKKRLLPRNVGHKKGVDALNDINKAALQLGVETLTVYAFSTENWSRPKEEIEHLFMLIGEYFDEASRRLVDTGIRVKVVGSRANLSDELKEKIVDMEQKTADGKKMLLNICFNYGSGWELAEVVSKLQAKNLEITPKNIYDNLYVAQPDLLIRTGGEKRLSNFLLLQCAYSELYFTDTFWPDFGEEQLRIAIEEFSGRARRFGRV